MRIFKTYKINKKLLKIFIIFIKTFYVNEVKNITCVFEDRKITCDTTSYISFYTNYTNKKMNLIKSFVWADQIAPETEDIEYSIMTYIKEEYNRSKNNVRVYRNALKEIKEISK